MTLLRGVFGVFAGHMLIAWGVSVFFLVAIPTPRIDVPVLLVFAAVVNGMAFAFVGGYLCGYLSKRQPLKCSVALAMVLAFAATVWWLQPPDIRVTWPIALTVSLAAPVAIVGGWLREHQLGVLEQPPAISDEASGSSPPTSPPTVWDRELDGPPLG
jgi:hypothetical protein